MTKLSKGKANPLLIILILIVVPFVGFKLFQFSARLKYELDFGNKMISGSRDAQRKEDLRYINQLLKLSLASGNISLVDTSSCKDCRSDKGNTATDGTGWIKFTVNPGKGGIDYFISQAKDLDEDRNLPVDPQNKKSYVYTFASDGKDYELNCVLERHTESMEDDGGNNPKKYEVGTNLYLMD
jgi:hypothetical protein